MHSNLERVLNGVEDAVQQDATVSRWLRREVIVGVAAAIVGVSTVVGFGAAGWPGQPFDCLDQPCWCERPTSGLVRQFGNTWSNLGPVFAGLIIGAIATRQRHKREHEGQRHRGLDVLGVLFPPVLVFQGIGSMYFHGGLTTWGSALDAMSMFASTSLLIATNMHRGRKLSHRGIIGFFTVMTWAGLIVGMLAPKAVPNCILTLFLSILLSEVWLGKVKPPASKRLFRIGIGVHLVGASVWLFSAIEGLPLCAPDSVFQGHGLWHLTSATAVLMFALHAFADLRSPQKVMELVPQHSQ